MYDGARMKHRLFRSILLFLIFASCQRQRPIPVQSAWNGTVELGQGIVLPFRMTLDLSAAKPAGYFLVGDEKAPIPEISASGDSLVFGFSEYGAEMRGTWNGRQWIGDYLRHRAGGTKSFAFSASPEDSASNGVAGHSSGAAFPTGNFQVLFQGGDRVDNTTAAKMWTKDGRLYGTFIAPDGDYGLLAGKQVASGIQLSRFTGWQAIVITLELGGETWSGSFHAASNDKPRPFILQPRADLNVATRPEMRTAMKNPNAEFVFSGMSISGETVRHTDDRFKGKALIVDVMGTWCHNCLDEAPVLQQLQDQYGNDGLEIVGLSFEISDDPDLAKKNLRLYRDRFGLTTTLLFCGSLDDANVDKQLRSQLDNFFAYPTTLFIDRKRKVQAIHSGFKGPGTGDEFQGQVREFDEITKRIVGK